ncbi:MAG: 4Fe-4S ferredoxin [Bacteroidales bacterium]|nr:4Fe-4S ferredoxin [Bacteroidales bacterium]
MKRDIITINEELCNGCGQCTKGCHEGALQLIDGKARLVSELYCDGLGACIGDCPTGAITVEQREAEPYDENAVMERLVPQGDKVIEAHLRHLRDHGEQQLLQQGLAYLREHNIPFNVMPILLGGGCPGSAQQVFNTPNPMSENSAEMPSQLTHWPVQLHLINPQSEIFHNADVLLAADCTAYTYASFHQKLLRGRKLAIACPKLDSNKESYVDKLRQMIDDAKINTLTVAIMEVPCCGGLLMLVNKALEQASRKVPVKKIVIGIRGNVLEETWI